MTRIGLICADMSDGREQRRALANGDVLLISLYHPNGVRGHTLDAIFVTERAAHQPERLRVALAIATPALLGKRSDR